MEGAVMRRGFGTFVLVILTGFFLLTSWSSGTAPARFAQQLGLVVANPGGYNEILAQYSGFFLAAAAVCIASFWGFVARSTALIMSIAVFGGLLAGRLVSLGLNGGIAGYGPTILALYMIDAAGLALATTAAVLDRRS
jgi:hypothetical protein